MHVFVMSDPAHHPVASFANLLEAQTARVLLDDAGVPSELGGAGVTSIDPFAAMYRRNVLLFVADRDRAAAMDVLRRRGYVAAIERAEQRSTSTGPPAWPRYVSMAGLLVVALSLILLFTQDDPVAWRLIAIGGALVAAGLIGSLRRRRGPAAPPTRSPRVREERPEGHDQRTAGQDQGSRL